MPLLLAFEVAEMGNQASVNQEQIATAVGSAVAAALTAAQPHLHQPQQQQQQQYQQLYQQPPFSSESAARRSCPAGPRASTCRSTARRFRRAAGAVLKAVPLLRRAGVLEGGHLLERAVSRRLAALNCFVFPFGVEQYNRRTCKFSLSN